MEEVIEIQKCDPEKREICSLLSNRLGSGHPEKGMGRLNIMNMINGEITFAGVVYRTTAKDRGMLFNFCPFCGADLEPLRKEFQQ